jgi:serine/threonine-protein kinase
LLAGKLPINGATQYQIMDGHLRQIPLPPQQLNPMIPEDLADLVMYALCKDVDERIPSAQEFLRGLDSIRLEKTITLPAAMARHIAKPDDETMQTPSPAPEYHHTATARAATAKLPVGTATKSDSSSVTGHPKEVIDQISKELAQYVGPIARVLVKKAAKKCTTTREIYETVAHEIDSTADRQRFLSGLKARR